MICAPLHERDSARWNIEALEAGIGASILCIVLPEQFDAGNAMMLRKYVQPPGGACMEVEISIGLTENHSLRASDLCDVMRQSCKSQFEYALRSAHPKTILSDLYDANGIVVGELLATFRHVHRPILDARMESHTAGARN
jgi:hypothetical protein